MRSMRRRYAICEMYCMKKHLMCAPRTSHSSRIDFCCRSSLDHRHYCRVHFLQHHTKNLKLHTVEQRHSLSQSMQVWIPAPRPDHPVFAMSCGSPTCPSVEKTYLAVDSAGQREVVVQMCGCDDSVVHLVKAGFFPSVYRYNTGKSIG